MNLVTAGVTWLTGTVVVENAWPTTPRFRMRSGYDGVGSCGRGCTGSRLRRLHRSAPAILATTFNCRNDIVHDLVVLHA